MLEKTTACGVVPGLIVKEAKLSDGSIAKYFVLREPSIKRMFTLGCYPKMSLAEAFRKASEWKEKIAMGIDPLAEEKAIKQIRLFTILRER